jgi:hypothetical protein
MAATKYGQYIKTLEFKDYGKYHYRQGTVMDSAFLGLDCHIQYGAFWSATRLGKEPHVPHVHDFDQVMVFLGSDTGNLGDLFGEAEMCMGENLEKHMITASTAVAIPKGTPHMPATINKMDKRIILMVFSLAAKYSAKPLPTDKKPVGPLGWREAKYGANFLPLSFRRKGAWSYGPLNQDDAGGNIAAVRTNDAGINFTMLYEDMKKAPYRLGPDPDNPHAHKNSQVMLFLGTDADDLSQLNAEFEICMGKEEERHVFTRPTAVITPEYLPHWPGGLVKCTRPIIMADIHPTGDSVVSMMEPKAAKQGKK